MTTETSLPPQSPEAEAACLGSLIIDQGDEYRSETIAALRPEYFYLGQNQIVFRAIRDCYEKLSTFDIVLLRDELKKARNVYEFNEAAYLVELAESTPSPVNGLYYAKIIREKAELRGIIRAASDISQKANDPHINYEDFKDAAERTLLGLLDNGTTGQPVLLADVIPDIRESMLSCTPETKGGLQTGFMDLDHLLSGLRAGELTVVAARPSMGKTALGLNIAVDVSLRQHKATAIFSLEMGRDSLVDRIVSGETGINSYNIRNGYLGAVDKQAIHDCLMDLAAETIIIDESSQITPLELKSKCRRLKQKHDLQLVVIDYLQLMHCPECENRLQEVSTISRQLKALARELNIPVIVMSQLNRQAENRDGNRPRLGDLRESGTIEQDADVVILLYREDYYRRHDPGYTPTNTAEVIVAKYRNGPTGTVKLFWQKETSSFRNLDRRSHE